MSPNLQIANYKVAEVDREFEYAIKNFIFMRWHKQITIQKPVLDFNASDKQWYDPDRLVAKTNFFKTQQQEKLEKLLKNKILLTRSLSKNSISQNRQKTKVNQLLNNYNADKSQCDHNQQSKRFELIKSKAIKKAVSSTVNRQKQCQVQKMYCKYLLNSLHKSNLMLIHCGVPPNLSVLETIEDGDYLKDGQRKDYPHYSNVIQPIDLPAVRMQETKIIMHPVKMDPREFFFSIQDNTVFKVKQVSMFLKKVFEESVKNCEMIREMNFRGDQSLRLENQNHNFQKLAEMIGVNFRSAKLLFDILNDHYDIEKQLALGRTDEYKLKVCKELIQLLDKEINEYFGKRKLQKQADSYSCFTPVQQYYLSLKDLGQIFLEVHSKAK